MKYVIIRANGAGVFAGYLKSRQGDEVILKNARRIWYWKGAASLSQMAMEGVKYPEDCKFPCNVDEIIVFGVVEIIDCTEKARLSIESVPIWSA